MYKEYYRRQRIKSITIISFLIAFAMISTYFIYDKFSNQRNQDVDTGKMEVVYHSKNGNNIDILKFNPVTDSVGLSSPSYDFTVKNDSEMTVRYKIILETNNDKINTDNCASRQIPKELMKLSFRKDSLAPRALLLSEYQDNVLYEDSLSPHTSLNYSIRIWEVNSDFIIDKNSHFHAVIKVVEEGE